MTIGSAREGMTRILRRYRRPLLLRLEHTHQPTLVTHPSAEWIARQLTEACGWQQALRNITATCRSFSASSHGAVGMALAVRREVIPRHSGGDVRYPTLRVKKEPRRAGAQDLLTRVDAPG